MDDVLKATIANQRRLCESCCDYYYGAPEKDSPCGYWWGHFCVKGEVGKSEKKQKKALDDYRKELRDLELFGM